MRTHIDRKRRPRAAKVAVAVALLAVAFAGVYLPFNPEPAREGVTLTQTRTPSPLAAADATGAPMVASNAPPAPAALPPKFGPARTAGDAEFDRLRASTHYAERRKALNMQWRCVNEQAVINAGGVRIERDPCRLSSDRVDGPEAVKMRKALVTECANAGDCWSELQDEHPDSRYHAFSDINEWKALEKIAYKAALDKADPYAMVHRARTLLHEANALRAVEGTTPEVKRKLAEAWSYEVASARGQAIVTKDKFSLDTNLYLFGARGAYTPFLTLDEFRNATNAGLALAEKFERAQGATS